MGSFIQAVAVVALLVGARFAPSQTCSVPQCSQPEYENCSEYCDANKGTTEFNNCLQRNDQCGARNRQEDSRHEQCENTRQRECKQEEQHQKYCRQHPDDSACQ